MADANRTVQVQLQAATGTFNRQMDQAVGPRSAIGRLGIVAAGAAAAAGVAVAGFAAASVKEFASLEKGMNEVFTLLPGMTDTAMGDMTQDVQDFAREFGVLPDDVVPALYDAISAGVPKDNVFAFLETANQLAVGGVTDLNTSVDALTSATNAYGTEQLSAADAADIMFTAVKQGKTTVDEIASAISDVAPIAAGLGVDFQDVAAALAAMTSQGEPTKTASTKVRQALSELSKAGQKAYTQFEEITGESFPEFIEGGGTFQQALEIMAASAEENGGRIGDMFGSIEAAQAAQMLTSDAGQEQVNTNLDAMAERAGATDEAFATMDQGISRTWDRMKASLSSFMTDIGERLGPVIEGILGGALDAFNGFADDVIAFLDLITGEWNGNWESIAEGQNETVQRILSIAQEMYLGIQSVFDLIVTAWETVLRPAWEAMEPFIGGVVNAVLAVIEATFTAIGGTLRTLQQLLTGDFSGAWTTMNQTVERVQGLVGDAVEALVSGAMNTLGRLKDWILGPYITAWQNMQTRSEQVGDGIRASMDQAFGALGGIARSGLEAVHTAWSWLTDRLSEAMSHLQAMFSGLGEALSGVLQSAFGDALGWLREQVNSVINAINGFITRLNSALEISLPSIGGQTINLPFGQSFDMPTISFPRIDPPDIPPIPTLGRGGMVTEPTLALIGEAGPEVVVPLDRMDQMGGDREQRIVIELDGRVLSETVVRGMPSVIRMQGA